MIISTLLKALGAILLKLLAVVAAQDVLEWMLFRLAKVITESTKTPHDDAFVEKIKEVYEDGKQESDR